MFFFETKIFDFTGTNIIIAFFKRKTIPKLDPIIFQGIKFKKNKIIKGDYYLKSEFKYRGGSEFNEFFTKFRSKKALKVNYYLKKKEIEVNKGNNKVKVINANNYKSGKYLTNDLYINDFYYTLIDRIIDFSYVSFGFLMISIIILLLNRDLSKSLGSIDNASGVSILIELAILLNKNPLEKIDILFLWCGAEEWGLWGSKQFCIKHFNDLNQEYNLDESYNINIDMVGTDIGLINKTGILKKNNFNKNIVNVLEATANNLKIPLRKFDLTIEPRSDHWSFRSFAKKAQKTMEVCCFLSNKDTKFIHSSRDTPNKCIPNNLKGCLDICYNAIKSINLRIE